MIHVHVPATHKSLIVFFFLNSIGIVIAFKSIIAVRKVGAAPWLDLSDSDINSLYCKIKPKRK